MWVDTRLDLDQSDERLVRYRRGGDRATAFSAAPTVRSQQPLVQSIHRLNRLVWLSLFICINFALWITFLFVNDIVTSLFHRLAEVFVCVCVQRAEDLSFLQCENLRIHTSYTCSKRRQILWGRII